MPGKDRHKRILKTASSEASHDRRQRNNLCVSCSEQIPGFAGGSPSASHAPSGHDGGAEKHLVGYQSVE